MHRDDAGRTWVASNRGLSRLEGRSLVPVPVARPAAMPLQIDSVTSDGRGGLWAYDPEKGLLHWNQSRFAPARLPPTVVRTRVVSTFTDSTGRAWFGFADGQVATSDGDDLPPLQRC